ncbi:type VI secretion system tip protein VgrG [Paraburkholderia sp. WC7.3g]|uniref:type VI secretion system Vgr family protein n=1 Tax=Paraburkholderia sp. WC7.3g TaxID=2991070 RepID=UPI003D1F2D06
MRPGIDVHQYYALEVVSTPSAALADIYSFTGSRGMGLVTNYTIKFTHPQRDLPRGDYINRTASFAIQPPLVTRWGQPEEARRIHGVITGFAQIASNHDQTVYEVTLESRLALLRNMPRTRFFFDMTEPEVIGKILRENGFNQVFADFRFELYRTYRKRPIITQWCEDDLTFLMRLCRRVGIWFVCESGKCCEEVRFGDDFIHYIRDRKRFTVPYQESNGLHSVARESVQSLAMRTTMKPATYSVRSYSAEEPNNERVNGTQSIHDDTTTYGETYTWGLDLDDEQDARREAELRQQAALAGQIVYTGTCDLLDIRPSCVLQLSNRELPEVKYGLLVTGMTCSASRKEGYKVEFTAIPSDRQYRTPLLEETWPRIQGVVTGTIASTKGYEGPYLDDQGRYIVNLHADRDARTPGLESCPMRLAKPFADLKAENQWLKEELAGLKRAVIALTAPHGVGIATPSRMMVSTGKDTSFATSSGFNVNALKNIALAAVEAVSVFAQRAGIRILAMRGKVQIQAQSDAMELVSQDNMQLSSAAGTLTANAANGVILQGGGTAYIKVHGDNVEIGGAGELILKIAGIDKSGPGALALPLPKFMQSSVTNNEKFVLCDDLTGRPLANRPYRIQLANGKIVEGKTTANGETSISGNEVAQGLKLMLQKNRNA